MATFMAAFHLRELMQQAEVQTKLSNRNFVNMDQVMLRYNGSKAYAARSSCAKASWPHTCARTRARPNPLKRADQAEAASRGASTLLQDPNQKSRPAAGRPR